jgi:hypothetical protein
VALSAHEKEFWMSRKLLRNREIELRVHGELNFEKGREIT